MHKTCYNETVQTQRDNLKNKKREAMCPIKASSISILADLTHETLEARRQWVEIFKVLKEKTFNQEFHNWQSCPSTMREKLKYTQISKS